MGPPRTGYPKDKISKASPGNIDLSISLKILPFVLNDQIGEKKRRFLMAGLKHRILGCLKGHPEGIDDDTLTLALGLSRRQTANAYCRRMEKEGLIVRKKAGGKTRNFLSSERRISISVESAPKQSSLPSEIWHWEGNVQSKVRVFLESSGYSILKVADTSAKEKGKDIEAVKNGRKLWITAKGYPVRTKRTPATVQAGHWFKDAIFDLLIWYGADRSADLGLALPDFSRYRKLLEKVQWLQGAIGFSVYWVSEAGFVSLSQVGGP